MIGQQDITLLAGGSALASLCAGLDTHHDDRGRSAQTVAHGRCAEIANSARLGEQPLDPPVQAAIQMPARERRLEDFTTVGEPGEGVRAQLLCEDHVGTYTTPFVCVRRAGEWVNEGTDDTIVCHVVGWREILPSSEWPASIMRVDGDDLR